MINETLVDNLATLLAKPNIAKTQFASALPRGSFFQHAERAEAILALQKLFGLTDRSTLAEAKDTIRKVLQEEAAKA